MLVGGVIWLCDMVALVFDVIGVCMIWVGEWFGDGYWFKLIVNLWVFFVVGVMV